MKKFLLVFLFILFAVAHLWAQTDQTVTNGAATTAVNFTGSGCTYNWVNSNPSIGLPASGTGNIPSFTAVNTGSSSVTATITATPAPNGFAYITNYKDNTVSVINTANNVLVTTIPVGSGPFGVSVSTDGNRVYITNRNDNTVSVINTSNNTVIATIPVGTFPWGVSVAPNGKRVYVTNSNDNTVSVIDNATNSVITTINVDKSPIGVSVSPDGSLVYVACYFTGTISVISTTTNKVVSTIQAGSYADGVIVSPDGNRIYVDDPINDNLYVIDATNGKVISIIKVGSECLGISISPDGTRVYTVNQADGTVSVINTLIDQVISTIPLGEGPSGSSLSFDGKWLYVTIQADNTLAIINAVTNTVTSTIPVGQLPISFGNFISPAAPCNGTPVSFNITVNPSIVTPLITVSAVSGNISACAGTASISPNIQQFTVSATNLQSAIIATAPPGFEVSLNAASGYGASATLTQTGGTVGSTIVYIRSAVPAATGHISGNVILSSTGAENQTVAVSGIVNVLPTVNKVADQTVTTGTATTAVNFSGGTGNTAFNWTNDTPGIGLPATGSGNIGSFTAINNGGAPITATITATPISQGYAYITNSGDGTVSVINVATNSIVSTIRPPHDPVCVCISPDGSKAYIGCSDGSSTVTIVNTITNAIISTIPVSASGESTGITVSPDGSMLYVANYVDGTVSAVNIATGAVTVIHVGPNPYGIAISHDGSKVYVAYTYSNYVSVINTATNTISANITVGTAPSDVAVSPDGSKVYVPVGSSNSISVIDPISNIVKATIPLGASPVVIAFTPDGTRAYVATTSYSTYPYPSSVLVVNTSTNAVLATIAVGAASNGISVSPDGNFVYVTNTETNDVSVINTSTNKVITTVKVGIGPISLGNFVTSGAGCPGIPTTFTITVNPIVTTPTITASAATGNISSCLGTASASPNVQQFTVSGAGLSANIMAAAPAGFELSLDATSGYSNSLTLTQTGGIVNATTIYIRSSASAPAGNISGNLVLSSTGATAQNIAVEANIDALPTITMPGSQTFVNGTVTNLISFSGTGAATYKWVNDMPGVGLAASGEGDITPFTAINNTNVPVTATITVTPFNSSGCSGAPVNFTITVTPSVKQPSLTVAGNLNPLTTIYGTPSSAESFTVSGVNITSSILISPPAGFDLSLDGSNFSSTVNAGSTPVTVYIRLAATTSVGSYAGNIVCSTANTANATLLMPNSTVTPAPLTIRADDKARVYGTANPVLTVTYSGFVNKDNAAALNPPVTVTTTATVTSAIGLYLIIVYGAGSVNYNLTYMPGTMTIQSLFLIIPNTFTPNGDGINDTWNIKNLESYPNSSVNIFNRWGQKLYASIGYPVPWDGRYNGNSLPAGTYYYVIDPKNGHAAISGWVAIIR